MKLWEDIRFLASKTWGIWLLGGVLAVVVYFLLFPYQSEPEFLLVAYFFWRIFGSMFAVHLVGLGFISRKYAEESKVRLFSVVLVALIAVLLSFGIS